MEVVGPFGLSAGQPLSSIAGNSKEVAPCKYLVSEVPKPHSAFENYILQISPKAGLSWIKALGPALTTSSYGHELQAAFESMLKKLEATYGKPSKYDFLMQDSIWNEPRDWLQALLIKERVLGAEWKATGSQHLKGGIVGVYLFANAIDTSSGSISIEYSFWNSDEGEKEIAALEDDAL